MTLEIRETKGVRSALELAGVVMGADTHPIGEITGAPGVGKTFAARHIAAKYGGARIPAWDGMSKYQMGNEIARAFGIQGPGQVDKLLSGRADPDPATRRLVLIDEANKLTWRVLELLRYLSDECNVAVLLCGTDLYTRQFVAPRTRELLVQLGSRIGAKRLEIKPLDRADTYTHAIRPVLGDVQDRELVTQFWQVSRRGNLREAYELANECKRLMAANGITALTQAVLDLAAQWMANRREVTA